MDESLERLFEIALRNVLPQRDGARPDRGPAIRECDEEHRLDAANDLSRKAKHAPAFLPVVVS